MAGDDFTGPCVLKFQSRARLFGKLTFETPSKAGSPRNIGQLVGEGASANPRCSAGQSSSVRPKRPLASTPNQSHRINFRVAGKLCQQHNFRRNSRSNKNNTYTYHFSDDQAKGGIHLLLSRPQKNTTNMLPVFSFAIAIPKLKQLLALPACLRECPRGKGRAWKRKTPFFSGGFYRLKIPVANCPFCQSRFVVPMKMFPGSGR